MKVREVIERYQVFCPPSLALDGDVTGLQFGSMEQEVRKVMVALDIREMTVAEAIEKEIDLIIVKHAPIFRALPDLNEDKPQNKIYADLIRHQIAVYVSHTDIDVVAGGLNDWFCEKLGLTDVEILHETVDGKGIGRVGVAAKQSLEELAERVKTTFGLDGVRLIAYQHDKSSYVRKVAICGGSGSEFYPDALVKGADVYITGDITYHTAQDMLTRGLLAIDPGHHIEVLFVEKVTEKLRSWSQEDFWGIDVYPSTTSTNPFVNV